MRASSDDVILALDLAVQSPRLQHHITDSVQRATAALEASTDVMAWETVPLDLFDALPASIHSCWIFVLRANQDTGAERHPNSHQRSLSLAGSGYVDVREEGAWRRCPLATGDTAGSVDDQWATIPPHTWHRWVVGPEHWAVLSFHTVPADQLIEERPSDTENLDAGPTQHRLYEDGDQPRRTW